MSNKKMSDEKRRAEIANFYIKGFRDSHFLTENLKLFSSISYQCQIFSPLWYYNHSYTEKMESIRYYQAPEFGRLIKLTGIINRPFDPSVTEGLYSNMAGTGV